MAETSNAATAVNGYYAHVYDDSALWLGTPVSLRLAALRPVYHPELLPVG